MGLDATVRCAGTSAVTGLLRTGPGLCLLGLACGPFVRTPSPPPSTTSPPSPPASESFAWATASPVTQLESQPPEPATATASSYKLCNISNGQVFSCGSWYQGDAVVLHDGAYKTCQITNGQVFSCGTWHQGTAVVWRDGAYFECKIANGQIFSCGRWYQGDAVVFTDR